MRSHLCIYELASGAIEEVLATDLLIEAPNWTPDGASLVVNGDGRMFRVPLDAPELAPIDTGHAVACNNDHGISPDGTQLVISDSTDTGQSCIWVLPVSGGVPRRVTREVPSWWHGWSPDGTTLALVGRRDGDFGIYTIDVGGGDETLLIAGGGHYDGPDYSPDGVWIWFNSDRGGSMDLWRKAATGGAPQQMTDDERLNWFPHPAPDGRAVLYLSYQPGTEGHPRDRDVELRLLDMADGSVRVLLALFGGQGSINVPCWSPDGARFAFVRYQPAAA
ncbi:WD40-like beta propeller repeat protein [Hoeflea sp. IMCC20628]|uniref:TolB family protein n=1 Tax=Hoeflea sp. IMCC20628 TaxID=1620421 RepID=UPI00063A8CC8|nr:TolB family protein [Hoeflea sp. IMCC20628]AKI02784.1 WD40-like beta propeller repeat protein [Hoeflea sp. IMCC20628]